MVPECNGRDYTRNQYLAEEIVLKGQNLVTWGRGGGGLGTRSSPEHSISSSKITLGGNHARFLIEGTALIPPAVSCLKAEQRYLEQSKRLSVLALGFSMRK